MKQVYNFKNPFKLFIETLAATTVLSFSCILQRWELIEPLIRQQDLCLAISAFTTGSKVKMEPCNTKEPRQVRKNGVSLSKYSTF